MLGVWVFCMNMIMVVIVIMRMVVIMMVVMSHVQTALTRAKIITHLAIPDI